MVSRRTFGGGFHGSHHAYEAVLLAGTLAQMVTHHSVNGCNLRPGDLRPLIGMVDPEGHVAGDRHPLHPPPLRQIVAQRVMLHRPIVPEDHQFRPPAHPAAGVGLAGAAWTLALWQRASRRVAP